MLLDINFRIELYFLHQEESMIDFLKLVSKINLSQEEKEKFSSFMESNDISQNLIGTIYKNKLQFLFIKHIIEQEQMEVVSNKLGLDISALLYFNNLLYDEYIEILEKITQNFETNNVKYCVLKGFSIIESLYRINGCVYRKFSDIDILVDKNDVGKVNRILELQGFVQGKINPSGEIVKSERKDILYWRLNSHQEHEYIKFSKYAITPFMRINIDINTTIFDGGKHISPISTVELLNHRQKKYLRKDKPFYTLDHTYELLQLCYHFYKDTTYEIKKMEYNDYSLTKFCDIREYILRFKNDIEWELFVKIINSHGLANSVGQVLYLVSKFYGDVSIDSIINKLDTTTAMPNLEVIFDILK